MSKTTVRNVSFSLTLLFAFLFIVNQAFASSATLNWNAPGTNEDGSPLEDLAGYWLYYGTSSGYYSNKVKTGNVTTYQVSNLAEGNTYYFSVTAYDTSGNESAASYEVSKTIAAPTDTSPPVIQIIDITTVTETSAIISWTTNESSTSQVEYGTTSSYGSTTSMNGSMVTNHSQTLAGLSPATLYHFRVSSTDANGNTGASNDYTFTTAAKPDTTPPAISGVNSYNISETSATISWTTNESSTSQVEYGTTSSYGSTVSLDGSMVTGHSQTLAGLSPSTLYYFRVRSKDASGNEAISKGYSFRTSDVASNTPPAVNSISASPNSGFKPLKVTFSVNASDPDGSIVKYEWDFDGDGLYDSSMTGNTASYMYKTTGSFTVKVRVTDNMGSTAYGETGITVSTSTGKTSGNQGKGQYKR